MKFKAILLISAFLLSQCNTKTPGGGKLEEGIINPSKTYRPLALWPWLNGYVDTSKLVFELEQMKDKGMRGALIWDVGALADPDKMIPAGPAMLGEQSLQYFLITSCRRTKS